VSKTLAMIDLDLDLGIIRFTQYEISIGLLPVELHKTNYQHLLILKFGMFQK
jgi:hypothetical protein